MVWSIETDDFRGFCHNQKYPLINTIVKTMAGGGKPSLPERPQIVAGDDNTGGSDIFTTTGTYKFAYLISSNYYNFSREKL